MPRKIKRRRTKGSEKLLADVRAQRGLDREAFFAAGGTLVQWMGGPRTVTKNKRRYRRPSPGSEVS